MDNPATVKLSDHDYEFAQSQVEQGLYRSVDDVVGAGLRMVEANERKLETLRQALIEGEQSGDALDFDFDDYIGAIGLSKAA
jgi:antitoxin ParD1/3/4